MDSKSEWIIPRRSIDRAALEQAVAEVVPDEPNAKFSLQARDGGVRLCIECPAQDGRVHPGELELLFDQPDEGASWAATWDELEPNRTDRMVKAPGVELPRRLTAIAEQSDGSFLVAMEGPDLLEVRRGREGLSCKRIPLMPPADWEALSETPDDDEAAHLDLAPPAIFRLREYGGEWWACGHPNLVLRGDGKFWQRVETGVPLCFPLVDVAPYGDELWLVTSQGEIWCSEDGEAERMSRNEALGSRGPRLRLSIRPRGEALWMTNGSRMLHRWGGETLKPVPVDLIGEREDGIVSLDVGPAGELWIASEQRLFVGDGYGWQEIALPEDKGRILFSLSADVEGGAWIAGEQGGKTGWMTRAIGSGIEPITPAFQAESLSELSPLAHGGVCGCGIFGGVPGMFVHRPAGPSRTRMVLQSETGKGNPECRETLFRIGEAIAAALGGWLEG